MSKGVKQDNFVYFFYPQKKLKAFYNLGLS